MAPREIDEIVGDTSEEHDRDSDELMLQNPVKLLHEYHQQLLILAFVTSVILQAVLRSEGMVGFYDTLQTGLADFSVLLSVMGLNLLVSVCSRRSIFASLSQKKWSIFASLQTYFRTVAVVLEDYVLLIMLNKKYIEIAIIPVMILAFIAALASKVRKYQNREVPLEKGTQSEYQSGEVLLEKGAQSEYQSGEVPLEKGTQSKLMKIAMVPYFLQLSLAVWIQFNGQLQDGIFIFSNFLLFLSSALCAVTVMIASPPFGLSPGVVQVLPVMHKTSIIMLMITTHSMAVEWLREDMEPAIGTEFITVALWFIMYYHVDPLMVMNMKVFTLHIRSIIRRVILGSGLVGAILACLASFYVEDGTILASRFISIFCTPNSSLALLYFQVWLLHQWPGSTPNSNGLIKLLKYCSVLSCACGYITHLLLCFL